MIYHMILKILYLGQVTTIFIRANLILLKDYQKKQTIVLIAANN